VQVISFLIFVFLSGLIMGCTKASMDAAKSPEAKSAVEKLQELVKTQPSYSNYINLGLELARAGRNSEALQAYKRATEVNPSAPLAWNNMCVELNGQKKFAEAIEHCEKALALDPKFQLARNNLEFAKSKRAEQAKELTKKKADMESQKSVTSQQWMNLGMELYNAREFQDSISVWTKIPKKDPLYGLAKNNIASSYIILKDLKKAETALNEALKLDPNNRTFVNNRAWLEDEKKKLSN